MSKKCEHVERLHNIVSGHIEQALRYERIIADLRKQVALHEARQRGDYWIWQGDGNDHLESLTCPIIIQAKDLRELCFKKDGA